MAVSLYFGLPGSGKSTLGTYKAITAQRRIDLSDCRLYKWFPFLRSKYDYVFTNFPVNYPGILQLRKEWLGVLSIKNALVIIDEATLLFDSRDHKSFSQPLKEFFLLHRHDNLDIILLTQQWDGVDKKIRVITDRCYYIHKGSFRRGITYANRIPYGIIIPDAKSDSESLGEIIQGYSKQPWYLRLFDFRFRRKPYYKFFDSWDRPSLIPAPVIPWMKLDPDQDRNAVKD